jgi:hypothetical protein
MLTQERLKELLAYDEETGVFTWKVQRNKIPAGTVASSTHNQGYFQIGIDRKRYLAHRLAWLYVYGQMPEHEIDHINHDKADNRIANLRCVTHAENLKNASSQKNNLSGFNGVHYDKSRSKWLAHIQVDRKFKNLGRFDDFDEAVKARQAAEVLYGFHENHGCAAN